ncbi:DUF2853 domain-containing protein [Nonlabens sp. MB-3u-79]|uniref:DUF2853 family protein n=1 Tax=Nonlabens sp. MB-3u-79 TaxID=2058134 RepID=UPI000C319B49|nr:DUF2853 family protein [Nonlabens sp. MB-3u-79]AUC79584.1 DUF2853 domain-containing protein [Nonlabens sp. MB-3u-79]|tara:strand:- start:1127 stop:1462 length:336 start_codon:yes stop_codon:yes gene_type:complete
MSKFDERIEKYIAAYKEKVGGPLNEELLREVTKGLGPSIYNKDAETVSAEPSEMQRVVDNYLVKKLGLSGNALMASVEAVMEKYGRSERAKYRACIYYMLCVHHGKESVYN